MQGVAAGGKVRIGDGGQIALGHDRPVIVQSFQIVSCRGILNGIVDDLREKLQLGDAAAHPERIVSFQGIHGSIETGSRQIDPVGAGRDGIPVGVNDENTLVTGQEQVALAVTVVPGVRGESAVEAALAVQQIIGNIFVVIQQIRTVHHVDPGAAHDKNRVRILEPDIIVVKVREVVKGPDGIVFLHIAEPVAGHQKNAV